MNRRSDAGNLDMEEIALRSEIADFQKMNEIRARVDAEVGKADAAEAPAVVPPILQAPYL